MYLATLTKQLRVMGLRWHQRLSWFGAFTLLLWGVSGISHPLMSWTGPKAEQFYPPSFTLAADQAEMISQRINTQDLKNARVLQLVPSESGPVLQITHAALQPRHYLALNEHSQTLNTGAMTDEQQARWLASYYTGRAKADIAEVEFITQFNHNYPWVNRLLPVYKISYQGGDELVAYVHTETSALASLSNRTKQSMQSLFQALHTWSWLGGSEGSRVVIITLFTLSLFAMALSGLVMIATFRSRKILSPARRWHRWLAFVIWLPLLGWSASGFYHLLQSSYITQPGERLQLPDAGFNVVMQTINPALLKNQALNSLSLVNTPQGPHYRLSLSPAADKAVSREQRYQGRPQEQTALYVDSQTGQTSDVNDAALAQTMALSFTGFDHHNVSSVSKVTRFGPSYDFRNKRLPVWQIDFNDKARSRLFIDTRTGVLVDSNQTIDRAERWSFSVLHKWSHLTGITGRFNRDLLIITCLVLSLLAGALGIAMQLKKRQMQKIRKNTVSCCSADA